MDDDDSVKTTLINKNIILMLQSKIIILMLQSKTTFQFDEEQHPQMYQGMISITQKNVSFFHSKALP
jgi:hypothetical protein